MEMIRRYYLRRIIKLINMNTLLLCLIISGCITYIYNTVDFPHTFTARILSRLYKKEIQSQQVLLPKILECSLCATFWITLVVLLVWQPYWWFMAFVFAQSTKYIDMLIQVVDKLITKFFCLIDRLLSKIVK